MLTLAHVYSQDYYKDWGTQCGMRNNAKLENRQAAYKVQGIFGSILKEGVARGAPFSKSCH